MESGRSSKMSSKPEFLSTAIASLENAYEDDMNFINNPEVIEKYDKLINYIKITNGEKYVVGTELTSVIAGIFLRCCKIALELPPCDMSSFETMSIECFANYSLCVGLSDSYVEYWEERQMEEIGNLLEILKKSGGVEYNPDTTTKKKRKTSD